MVAAGQKRVVFSRCHSQYDRALCLSILTSCAHPRDGFIHSTHRNAHSRAASCADGEAGLHACLVCHGSESLNGRVRSGSLPYTLMADDSMWSPCPNGYPYAFTAIRAGTILRVETFDSGQELTVQVEDSHPVGRGGSSVVLAGKVNDTAQCCMLSVHVGKRVALKVFRTQLFKAEQEVITL